MSKQAWQFWIDRGGTFTDVVARAPDGRVLTAKLLSEDPTRAEDAAIAAIRHLSGAGHAALPPSAVRMGTTVATNALLERKGEPTVLATTRGFGDALRIGAIGERHGLSQAQAAGHQGCQRGDDGVASAGDVEDLVEALAVFEEIFLVVVAEVVGGEAG